MSRAREFADLAGSSSNISTVAADSANLDQVASSYSAGGITGKNLIINGAMQVAQRGTSVTGLGDGTVGYVGLDRFRLQKSGSPLVRYTMTQDSNAPAGFNNSMKLEVTTADSSVGSDHLQYIDQFIEAQNLQQLSFGNSSAKSITLSFYVKCSTAQTFALELINEDNSRYFNTTYVVSSADTWERKTITFPADTASGFNDDDGRGLRVRWVLAAGSNFTDGSVSTAWSGTQHIATNHQNTWVAATSRTWQITGIQLELGETATPFEHRSFGDELARCQRYFYKTTYKGSGDTTLLSGTVASAALAAQCGGSFPVTMRSAPTAGYNGSITAYDGSQNPAITSLTANGSSTTNATVNAAVASGLTLGRAVQILSNSSDDYMTFDAEL